MTEPVCTDLETYPIAPGQQFPRIVLGAVRGSGLPDRVLVRDDLIDWFAGEIRTGVFVNHSIAFDLGCIGAARPDLLPDIFQAYSEDRIGCTHMLCQLYDIGVYGSTKGGRRAVPESGPSPIDRPYEANGKLWVNLPPRYNLAAQAQRWLGVRLEKDERRTTFDQFDGVPISEIPADYLAYVTDDLCALDLWRRVHATADFSLENVWALSRRDFALKLIEARGRYVDPVMLEKQRAKWKAELEEAFTDLRELGWVVEKRGPRKKYKEVAGFTKPTKHRKAWAARFGVSALTEKGLQKGMEEGTVTPRRAGLVLDYLRAAPRTPARARFFRRAGLWADRFRTRYEPGEGTGEWKRHKAPIEARIEAVGDNRKIARTPKTKAPKITDENTFGDPMLEKAVVYSRAKTVGAYFERLAGGVDQPLHMRISGMAATGRTTSGGEDDAGNSTGVNDQNHRREYGFRECFIPRRKFVYVSIDYSQAELCALGEIQTAWFGYSELADAINAGADCHLKFVARFREKAYEDVLRDKALHKDDRQLGKAYNFGKPGALAELKFVEWARIAYGVTIAYSEWRVVEAEGFVPIAPELRPKSVWTHAIPPDLRALAEADGATFVVDADPKGWERVRMSWLESQGTGEIYCLAGSAGHLDALFFSEFTATKRYLETVKVIIRRDQGVVYTHKTNRRRAGCTLTSGANNGFQALVADGATEALFRVQWACYAKPESPLYGSGGVWFSHDEIGLECPSDRLHEAAYEASRIMEETMREFTPNVRSEAKPAAMRRWTKRADDPRFGADGRLIPEEDWHLEHDSSLPPEKRLKPDELADVLDLFERYGLERMK